MNNGRMAVPITENILMTYFLVLEEQGQVNPLPITNRVLESAVEHASLEILRTLLKKRQDLMVTGATFVSACRGVDPEKLSLLFEQPYDSLPITEMIKEIRERDNCFGEGGRECFRCP